MAPSLPRFPAAAGLLLATFGACSGSTQSDQPAPDAGVADAEGVCRLGQRQACACTDGPGSQVCDATGQWGSCRCAVPPDAAPTHRVISTSTSSVAEAETHLAIAPDGSIAVVWIAIGQGAGAIGYTLSRDGGGTWSNPGTMGDPDGRESSDPVVAVDAQGAFYATWISFLRGAGGNPSDFVLYVARLAPGASAFSTPVAVDTFTMGDKPWIVVTAAGTVLVTYMADVAGVSTLYAARSGDRGATWTKSTILAAPGGDSANFVVPCAPKTGARVWATYLSIEGNSFGQRLRWSDDDGATWPAANSKYFADQASAVPSACAARGSDVWVAYGRWRTFPSQREAPLDEARVVHTTDGVTFTRNVKATDDKTAKVYLQDLVVDDVTGDLVLTYYGGDKDGDPAGTLRRTFSKDKGATWAPSEPVVTPTVTFTADRGSLRWLGDYVGTFTRGSDYYVSYVDNTDRYMHIAFFKGVRP
jgi:hypothetical protein